MNQNRSFYSTNTNLYDEAFRSSAPTTLNGKNVILSQEQQRRVCDTLNTSIVGNPFIGSTGSQQMWAQKQYFPGGVLFSFPPTHMVPPNLTQGQYCKCTPMSVSHPTVEYSQCYQPAAPVNTFFPSSIEYPQLQGNGGLGYYQQQPPRDPFQLKFHQDHSTSCSDLLSHLTQVPASKGLPDLCNINGALQTRQQLHVSNLKNCQTSPEILFPSPPIEFSSSNAKKLILSKCVPPILGHVIDVLDENTKNEHVKKKVSFSGTDSPATENKSFQISSDCICDAKKCKSKSKIDKKPKTENNTCATKKEKKQKEKKKETSQSDTSSETILSSDCEDHASQKAKKKWCWPHQSKTESGSSDTQASDSENDNTEDSKIDKKKKTKKGKCKDKPKSRSANDLQPDEGNQPDSGSERTNSV